MDPLCYFCFAMMRFLTLLYVACGMIFLSTSSFLPRYGRPFMILSA